LPYWSYKFLQALPAVALHSTSLDLKYILKNNFLEYWYFEAGIMNIIDEARFFFTIC
jgi:hypothetical protein